MAPQHTRQPQDPIPTDEVWLDEQAGPVVRPYAVTGGRTQSDHAGLDLITFVVAIAPASPMDLSAVPEHAAIVACCQRPLSVAEVAAQVDLPLGTVRVLLGDLLERGLIAAGEPQHLSDLPDEHIFQAVINGLRSL